MSLNISRSDPNYRKLYYNCNKEREMARQKEYKAENIEWIKPLNKQWSAMKNIELRQIIINKLGGHCACCGESQYEFLSIDHINGGGNEEKREHGRSMVFYKYIIEQGCPKDKYQILCHSCNQAKHDGKECPHNKFNVFDRNTWLMAATKG